MYRVLLKHKEEIDNLFEILKDENTKRQGIHYQKKQPDLVEIYKHLHSLTEILEAALINYVDDSKRTDEIINVLTESNEEKDKIILKLRNEIEQRNKEYDEFLEKYRQPLKFVNDYFEHAKNSDSGSGSAIENESKDDIENLK
jgi:hypothetical protein